MLKKWLMGRDATRARDSYIWNSISGFANALQSTFILVVLQRLANEGVSGVFTIAFATANLMLSIGKYGVRYYQVSDVENRYSYGDYFYNRLLTVCAMIVATVGFCAFSFFFGEYAFDKAVFCLILCLQKVVDAIEDVVHGEYQKADRLDVAGRAFSLRLFVTVATFIVGFAVTDSLVWAALISLVGSVVAFAALLLLLQSEFARPRVGAGTKKAVWGLVLVCLPLFASTFLSLFIVNAPKYAIDGCLTSEAQAIYGFVSLPVFVVSLLAECLFRPMVTSFATAWHDGEISLFCKRIWLVTGGIGVLTVGCIIGGVWLGVPVLAWLFNADLIPHRLSVGILLLGGGLLALTSFLTMILTVMHRQKSIALAHIGAAVVSLPISYALVRRSELLGASVAYLVVIALLCASVIAFLCCFVWQRKRELQGKAPTA